MSSIGTFDTSIVPGMSGVTAGFYASVATTAAYAATAFGRTMTHVVIQNNGPAAVSISWNGGTTTHDIRQAGEYMRYDDVAYSTVSLLGAVGTTCRITAW